jgi:hypothetical protein
MDDAGIATTMDRLVTIGRMQMRRAESTSQIDNEDLYFRAGNFLP